MKVIMFIALTISFSAFSQSLFTKDDKKLPLEDRKKIANEKIMYLESHVKLYKSCVDQAPTSAAIDQCIKNGDMRMKKFKKGQ